MRIYAALAILSLLGAGAWYVISLAADNERLEANNATLQESNSAHADTIAALEVDKAAKDAAIIARTKKIFALNEQILKAKDDVRKITRELVTEQERECLRADVPDAIISFMFDHPTGGDEAPIGEGLPSPTPVQ